MTDVRVAAGPASSLDQLRDGDALERARARAEVVGVLAAVHGLQADGHLVALRVDDQGDAESSNEAQGLFHRREVDRREVRRSGIDQEGLESRDAGPPQRQKLFEVAGDDPAPESDIDVNLL